MINLIRETKKKKKTQITNVRKDRSNITTDSIDIKEIIIGYNEYFYANKIDSLGEMEKLFERHKLLKLTQKKKKRIS